MVQDEYTTVRIKRDILFKLIELRGKLKLDNIDEVVETLLKRLGIK